MGSDGSSLDKFKCGGSGSPKATYAICAYDDGEYSMHKVGRPDWGTVSCEPGYTQVGGGCDAKSSPHVFEWNGPMTRYGWKCGGGSGGDQGSRSGAKDVVDLPRHAQHEQLQDRDRRDVRGHERRRGSRHGGGELGGRVLPAVRREPVLRVLRVHQAQHVLPQEELAVEGHVGTSG